MKSAYLWASTLCLLLTFHAFGQCNMATNLALGRPAYASSLENSGYTAGDAFDGSMTTRWSSQFSDPQWIYVDLGASYALCGVTLYWENAYATAFTIDVSNDASTWTTVASISGNASTTNNISISVTARYVRMSGISRATQYGYSLYEFQVFGTAGSCGTNNLALNQPATASSVQLTGTGGTLPQYAFDGDMTTRWGSDFSDPQWIYVDLGTVYPLCQVALFWENAYGTNYEIDLSNDATNWTTAATVTGNTSQTNYISISGSGRYVRMYGTVRATQYGYSIYEMEVFGPTTLPVQFIYFDATRQDNSTVGLAWATGSETDNDRFVIERSANGVGYSGIDSVPGQGNSTTEKQYQATDPAPLGGPNYYRIKQVDANGHYTYSTVAEVTMPLGLGAPISVYPNPVTDVVQINTDMTGGELIIRAGLYTMTGVKLNEYSNASGVASTQLSCTGLSDGIYVLRVETNREVKTFKLVKGQ